MKKMLALIVLLLIASSIVEASYGPKWREDVEKRVSSPLVGKLFLIFIVLNIILLLALLILYMISFAKTKSSFTLGLVFFIGVLLIQKVIFFLGMFVHSFLFLPPFFETLALIILLVLSLE